MICVLVCFVILDSEIMLTRISSVGILGSLGSPKEDLCLLLLGPTRAAILGGILS